MTPGDDEPSVEQAGAGVTAGQGSVAGPSGTDLSRFWHLSLAMMGVGSYDGYFTLVNPAYEQLLGWSVDELMSVPYWEFIHAADRDAMVESGQDLIDNTATSRFGYEVRMLCRNGSYRWTRWNTKTIPQDQLLYVIGVDISDSRDSDAEHTVAASWVWDIGANSFEWSAEMHELLGMTDGPQISFDTYLRRVYEADRGRVARQLRACVVDGEPYVDEFRVERPDGELRVIHAAGRQLAADAERQRMHGIAIDVTDPPSP
jgi:PAS domain S-box-containing protein